MNPRQLPTLAMNPEEMRKHIFAGVRVPPGLLQKAIENTDKRLSAKKIKHFAYQGEIVSKVEVEDWSTQANAADQIFSIAGVLARRDEKPNTMPSGIELIIDPDTGAVRLRIGHAMPQAQIETTSQDEFSVDELNALETQLNESATLNDGSVVLPPLRVKAVSELKQMLLEASQMRDED